jgi:hypothetical protein
MPQAPRRGGRELMGEQVASDFQSPQAADCSERHRRSVETPTLSIVNAVASQKNPLASQISFVLALSRRENHRLASSVRPLHEVAPSSLDACTEYGPDEAVVSCREITQRPVRAAFVLGATRCNQSSCIIGGPAASGHSFWEAFPCLRTHRGLF